MRLIKALAVDDDEAVFPDRRFEMAVEVVSGFTPNSFLIFSLTSSAAAEASSSQRSSEQRGLGFTVAVSDAEAAISEDMGKVSLVEAAAFIFINLPFPAPLQKFTIERVCIITKKLFRPTATNCIFIKEVVK